MLRALELKPRSSPAGQGRVPVFEVLPLVLHPRGVYKLQWACCWGFPGAVGDVDGVWTGQEPTSSLGVSPRLLSNYFPGQPADRAGREDTYLTFKGMYIHFKQSTVNVNGKMHIRVAFPGAHVLYEHRRRETQNV